MKYTTIIPCELPVRVRLSSFERAGSGEYHAVIEGTDTLSDAAAQYACMADAMRYLTEQVLPGDAIPVMKRYFVSDAANQAGFLADADDGLCAVSIVQQPPLDGTKVALWAYFVQNADVTKTAGDTVAMERSSYRHLWDMQMHTPVAGEGAQTDWIFAEYIDRLDRRGCTLLHNAIRTWIFVQGVDIHYAGMVAARRSAFEAQGLTPQTHYIASTGIEGRHIDPKTLVLVDAYSIAGLREGQISHLKGSTHLNPTHEYGVTFERATAVDYGDRRHVFVSGTASIDNRGGIVHPLDVAAQTGRTLENVGVLLAEGGMTMDDVAQMIVYVRDTADYLTVSSLVEERHPGIPKVMVWAPVCRPGWLVEIECIAIREAKNDRFPEF